MEILVKGISFHASPVDVRERVSLTGDMAIELLRSLHGEQAFSEALVINTCNRTEFYIVMDQGEFCFAHLLEHVSQVKGGSPTPEAGAFYERRGPAAVTHLFRVAASLDSQIVGEHEILGQVKSAYRQALSAGTAQLILNRLMHSAFRVGKRVQTETALGQGAASVA